MVKGCIGSLAIVAGLLALSTLSVSAAGAGSPGIHLTQPGPHGYFEATAKPGDVIHSSFVMSDLGDVPGHFLAFASDGMTSAYSGVVYGDRSRAGVGVGGWINVPSAAIDLAPQQTTTIPFTITVPPDASPGDHVGAISAENPEPSKDASGQFTLGVTQRTVEAVVIHVPGPVDTTTVSVGKAWISTENGKRQLLNLPLTYGIDVLGKPRLNFAVSGPYSGTPVAFDSTLDTFTPHAAITYVHPLDNVLLPAGHFCVSGSFGLNSHEQTFKSCFEISAAQANVPAPGHRGPLAPVTGTDWRSLGIAGTGFLIILGLLFLLGARRRHWSMT